MHFLSLSLSLTLSLTPYLALPLSLSFSLYLYLSLSLSLSLSIYIYISLFLTLSYSTSRSLSLFSFFSSSIFLYLYNSTIAVICMLKVRFELICINGNIFCCLTMIPKVKHTTIYIILKQTLIALQFHHSIFLNGDLWKDYKFGNYGKILLFSSRVDS